jgi:hypothetical protein
MPETKTKGKNATFEEEVQATIKRLEAKDPGLKQFLKKAYGYAVFPSVGKAALVVGGAYGKGLVFERGKMIGYATMGQFTLGVQLGGDTFSEVLVFESKESLDRFKKGRTAFAANASAVLVKAAAGGTADFEKGVAALAYTRGGMMLEMAIGGQKFKFKPAGEEEGEEGGGKEQAGRKGQSARSQGEESEGEEDQEGEEGDEDQQSGFLGRALGGVRGAASKTTDLVKGHPVIATVVGTGLVATAVIYVVRSIRAASEGQESQGEDEGQEEGDEEGQAEDQAESQDEGEEQEQDDAEQDDAEDSQNGHNSPRMMRRGKSRV